MSARRFWVLYDGRARGAVGTDDATVLSSETSESQARRAADEMGTDAACYSYRIGKGGLLEDEKWEWDA